MHIPTIDRDDAGHPLATKLMEVTAEQRRAALDAIKHGPEAWSEAKTLELAGHALETLESLESAKPAMVERWELAAGLAWTLTPIAAAELGVRIDERWERVGAEMVEIPRWVPTTDPAWPFRVQPVRRQIGMPYPDQVVDPLPGPEWLVDETNGEPIRLFAGPDGRGGIPIVRDKRRRPRNAPPLPERTNPRPAKVPARNPRATHARAC